MPQHISEVMQDKQYEVIAEGKRFILASEDAPRFPRGHGGNPFIFKLRSGAYIYSSNVWSTGDTDKENTADVLEYKDWASVGVSEFGALQENSDAYVFSKKYQ